MGDLSPNRSLNITMRTTPSSHGSVGFKSSRRSSRNTSIGSRVFSDNEDNDENIEPNKSPIRSSNRSINKSRLSLDSSAIVDFMEELTNTKSHTDDNNNNNNEEETNDILFKSLILSATKKSKQKAKSKSVNNSINKSTNNDISTYDEINDNEEVNENEVNENEVNENEVNVSLADMINKSAVSSDDGSPEVYKNYYAVLAGTPSVDMSTFSLADIRSDSGVSTGDKRSWSNRSPALNTTGDDNTTSFNFKESDGRRVTADPADLATLIDDINNESVNVTSDRSNTERSMSQQANSISTSTTPSGKSPYRKKMNRSSAASNLEISIDLNETNTSVMSVSYATINLAEDSAEISFHSSKSPANEGSENNGDTENVMNISAASNYSSSRLSLSAAKNGRRMTVDPADMEALINCLDDSGVSIEHTGRESIDTAELMMSVEGATNDANVNESEDLSMVSSHTTRSTRSRKSIDSVVEDAVVNTSVVSTRSTRSRKSIDSVVQDAVVNTSIVSTRSTRSRKSIDSVVEDADLDTSVVSNHSTRSRKSIDSVVEDADADTSVVSNHSRKSNTSRKSDASGIPTPSSTYNSSRLSLSAAKNGRRMTVDPADMEALINCLDDSGVSIEHTGRESIDTAELMMSVEGATNDANVNESEDLSMVSSHTTRSTRSRKSIDSVVEDADADTSVVSNHSRKSNASRKSDASGIPTPSSTYNSSRLSLSAAKNGRRMTVDPADMEALMGTLENESSTVSATSVGRESIDTAELMISVEGVIDQSYENNTSNTLDSIVSRKSTPSEKACNSVTSSPRVIRSSSKKSDKKNDRRVTADPVDMALLISSLKDDDILSPAKDSRRMTADPADMLALISGLESEDLNDSSLSHHARPGRESIDTVYLVESVAATLNGVDNDEMNESLDANSSYGSLGGLVCIDKSDNFTPTKSYESPDREKTAPASILKSCLSSRKMIPQSLRKNVIFGSPKAAEFHKFSPTTSFTPLNRQEAKSLYSMSGKSQREIEEEAEDEATAENSKILDEWDRLTNNSENGSDDESEMEEAPHNASTLSGFSSASSRRRRSMLQPHLEMDTSNRSEVSATVALPGNLADLIAETENMNPQDSSTLNESEASKVSHTQELEMDLHSLLRQEYTGISEDSINENLNSSAAESSKDELHVSTSTGVSNESSQRSLGPLLGLEPLKAVEDSQNVSQSMDTTMSDVASNESEVSFRHSFGYRGSVSGPYSALKANSSNISMSDGHTVQLENKLGDMIANLGDDSCILDESIQHNQSHMSIRSDNDFTQGLENNLGALMQQIGETSNICENSVQNLDMSLAAGDVEYDGVDVSTATTEAANSMQEIIGADDLSIADTSVCISASVDRSVSANIGASDMLERLRALNAGAHRNSLSQCGTPLASANRLSLGLPRLSIANFSKQLPSAKKSRTEKTKLDNSNIQVVEKASETEAPSFVDLDTLFATLGVDKNSFEKSSKLLDILKAASNTEYESFNIILNGIIADLLGAAASEIKASVENDKKLKELWAQADVNSIRLVNDAVIGNRKPAKQALIKLANQCTQMAERNWDKWEAKLLELTCQAINHQTEAVSEVLETLVNAREENEAKKKMQEQEEEKSILENNDHNVIRELQLEIRVARRELEAMKKKAADIDEQASLLLEEKMNRMIALSNGNEEYRAAVQNVSQNEAQLQELQEHENRLCETQQYIEIVNRLSHCSVLSYKSTGIVIEAQLSSGLSCIITFNFQNKYDKLIVSNMNVDLESKSETDVFDSLANAYFADVLASDEISGPLSNRVLDNVTKPSDIPPLLRQISGYISALRRMKGWLDCFTVDKWTWGVDGNRIVVVCPDSSKLIIPLKVVVSGNIAALSPDCLQDNSGAPIHVAAMRSSFTAIHKACSAPFGSFPSNPLKRVVKSILKLN